MKNLKTLIVLLLITSVSLAQTECPMEIGTNLGGMDSQVFKDLKKASTHFFTTNIAYLAGDSNYWDTELIDLIPTDQNGYPTIDVPFNHASVGTTQIYHFLAATDSIYPTGSYELLYDGTGDVFVSNWTDASNINYVSSGRITFDIPTTSSLGIHVEIRESDASDYIRNIRIIHVDDLSTYEMQPFREELISLSSEFACLRFMDWCGTNELYYDAISPYNTTPLTWSERINEDKHRFTDEEGGLSYESIIKFANAVEKDIWLNIPHRADANYITQMANLFHDQLNENIIIHLEFSNEVWNGIFQQTDYVENEGPHTGIGFNYGHFAGEAFQIWKTVYGSDRNQLKFVLAGHDWTVMDALTITNSMGLTIDEVSYPGYFNLGNTGWGNLDALGAAVTVNDIISEAQNNMHEDFYWMMQFKTLVCDPNDIEFVMYEGGQHLLRLFGVEEVFQNALYQTQISSQMEDLYIDLLEFCRDSLEVTLFNHFNLYGPNESNFGSWGMIESVYETPNTAKYNALKAFMCDSDEEEEEETSISSFNFNGISIYPNPANSILNIEFEDSSQKEILIYSLDGQIIYNSNTGNNTFQINISNFNNGIYILRINSDRNSYVKEFIKL